MPGVEVLVRHGPPGSGKTTLSRAIAELLRMADVPHAVIDLDDVSNVFPLPRRSFARENLQGHLAELRSHSAPRSRHT